MDERHVGVEFPNDTEIGKFYALIRFKRSGGGWFPYSDLKAALTIIDVWKEHTNETVNPIEHVEIFYCGSTGLVRIDPSHY